MSDKQENPAIHVGNVSAATKRYMLLRELHIDAEAHLLEVDADSGTQMEFEQKEGSISTGGTTITFQGWMLRYIKSRQLDVHQWHPGRLYHIEVNLASRRVEITNEDQP